MEKKSDSRNPRVVKTKNFIKLCCLHILKLRFIKKQEASGILCMLGLRTTLSKNYFSWSYFILRVSKS